MAIKFLLKISLFILIIALNTLFYELVLQFNEPESLEKELLEQKEEIEVLILGDSHPKLSLNPLNVKNSFNLTTHGENYLQTYARFKSALEIEGFNPKIIILPLDWHSFSSFRAGRFNNEWYWQKHLNFFELAFKLKKPTLINQAISAFFYFKERGEGLLAALAGVSLPKKGFYWQGFNGLDNDFSQAKNRLTIAQDKVERHFKDAELLDKTMLESFLNILKLAQDQQQKVILISFPVSIEYYLLAKEQFVSEATYQDVTSDFLEDFDNIYYLDYQNLYFNNPELFFDSDHLNVEGAALFSRIIQEEIEKNQSKE